MSGDHELPWAPSGQLTGSETHNPCSPPQLLTLNVLSQTNSCLKPLSLGWLHAERRLPVAFLSRLQWSPGWAGEEAG